MREVWETSVDVEEQTRSHQSSIISLTTRKRHRLASRLERDRPEDVGPGHALKSSQRIVQYCVKQGVGRVWPGQAADLAMYE